MSYKDTYASWMSNPEAFWMNIANAIDWHTKPTVALNRDNAPLYEWFTDAKVNTCYNAVDRHVLSGRGNQAAIIYDSPVTDTKYLTSLNYRKRLQFSRRFIGKGISKVIEL